VKPRTRGRSRAGIRCGQGKPGLPERYPWVIAFAFGLLHGLGFAGALAEVGLPQNAIPLALLFFNVGVEIGQLVFIAVPRWWWRIPPYVIGGLANFWVFERVAAF
jgi:hypothetical protein